MKTIILVLLSFLATVLAWCNVAHIIQVRPTVLRTIQISKWSIQFNDSFITTLLLIFGLVFWLLSGRYNVFFRVKRFPYELAETRPTSILINKHCVETRFHCLGETGTDPKGGENPTRPGGDGAERLGHPIPARGDAAQRGQTGDRP